MAWELKILIFMAFVLGLTTCRIVSPIPKFGSEKQSPDLNERKAQAR